MATILLKKRDTTGAPSAGDLTNSASGAEVAVNTYDKRLYSKDSGGNVVELGTAPSTIDINAGTIDGATIGANSASTGAFTTLTSSSTTTLNGTTIPASKTLVVTTDIGSTVQGYDADTAKTDTAQTFTASQRGTVTTDNDGSFSMTATNNFKCTPTGNFTLTFTNITAGQSGNIWLDNSGGYTVSAHSAVYINADTLAALSTAGVYWLSYYSPDGTNVAVAATGAIV